VERVRGLTTGTTTGSLENFEVDREDEVRREEVVLGETESDEEKEVGGAITFT
jgi:hypothetical protein